MFHHDLSIYIIYLFFFLVFACLVFVLLPGMPFTLCIFSFPFFLFAYMYITLKYALPLVLVAQQMEWQVSMNRNLKAQNRWISVEE